MIARVIRLFFALGPVAKVNNRVLVDRLVEQADLFVVRGVVVEDMIFDQQSFIEL